MMKKQLVLLSVVALVFVTSCDLFNIEPDIFYWDHTLTSSEVTYFSDSPYGYYVVAYRDTRFTSDSWFDIWAHKDIGGGMTPLGPLYDVDLGITYYRLDIYSGKLEFLSPSDIAGSTIRIYTAPTAPWE